LGLLFWQYGVHAAYSQTAADVFYYLSVATNTHFPMFSFNGQDPTNGFHPLWQVALTGLAQLVHDREILLDCTLGLSALLTTTGFCIAVIALTTLGTPTSLALFLIPGSLFLALGTINTPWMPGGWAFMNGMETGLTILFIGCFLLLVSRFLTSRDSLWAFVVKAGLLMPLIVLSRLDDIFLLVGGSIALLVTRDILSWRQVRIQIMLGLPTVIVVAAYLAFNLWYSGFLLPVSGAAKSGFAAPKNGFYILCLLFPPVADLINLASGKNLQSFNPWDLVGWRAVQMIWPVLLAGTVLLCRRSLLTSLPAAVKSNERVRCVLIWASSYIVLKSLYNFLNVGLVAQGNWYYAGSLVIADFLLLGFVLGPALSGAGLVLKTHAPRAALLLPFVALLLAANAYFEERSAKQGVGFRALMANRETIRATLDPGQRIIDFDDGVFAYSLGAPAISGLGLVASRWDFEARKHGRFLHEAVARGYDVFCFLQYSNFSRERSTSEQLRNDFLTSSSFRGEGLDIADYDYRIFAEEPHSRSICLKATARHDSPASDKGPVAASPASDPSRSLD
jgi:hypothetical protein